VRAGVRYVGRSITLSELSRFPAPPRPATAAAWPR
jgi:hypothetical protein